VLGQSHGEFFVAAVVAEKNLHRDTCAGFYHAAFQSRSWTTPTALTESNQRWYQNEL
jgi:hypothetical protein